MVDRRPVWNGAPTLTLTRSVTAYVRPKLTVWMSILIPWPPGGWSAGRRRLRRTHEEVPIAGMEPTIVGAELPVVGQQERISLDTQTGCQPEGHSPLARGRPGNDREADEKREP